MQLKPFHAALVAALAVAALAGPARADTFGRNELETRRQQAFARAERAEAGSVRAMSGETLVFVPYGEAGERDVRVDASTPIFQGGGTITTRGLVRGVDVRVHLAALERREPQAVAVEVLTPAEASLAREHALAARRPRSYEPGRAHRSEPRPVARVREHEYEHGDHAARVPSRAEVLRDASGHQAGIVARVDREHLILDPYEVAAGDATLRWQHEVAVFDDGRPADPRRVRPGTDVRIHYRRVSGDRPRVVAIDLLDRSEAEAARVKDNPRRDARAHGRHSQPGRLKKLDGDWLVLDPYQRSAGDARLRFSDDVPVYRGGSRVGTESLDRGDDVRVWYEGNRVVAVDLLGHDEAKRLEKELKHAGKRG